MSFCICRIKGSAVVSTTSVTANVCLCVIILSNLSICTEFPKVSNLRASFSFLPYSKKQGVNMKGFGFLICLALLILFNLQQALGGCTEWSEWTSCRDGGQGRQRSCAGLKVGSKSFTSAVRGCSPQGCGACPGIPGYCSSSDGLR